MVAARPAGQAANPNPNPHPHPNPSPSPNPHPSQAKLVDAVVESGTPTVLVLINGGPLAVLEPRGGALVEAFYGGQAAGEGLAAVLYGEVNPSGRMPVTAYASEVQAGDIQP